MEEDPSGKSCGWKMRENLELLFWQKKILKFTKISFEKYYDSWALKVGLKPEEFYQKSISFINYGLLSVPCVKYA